MTSQDHSLSENYEKTGSSSDGEPVFVVVGKLRKPHGVRGEMKMTVFTEFQQSLAVGEEVFVGESRLPLVVRSTRWHGEDLLISFQEYTDRDEVGLHRNEQLFVRVEDLPPLTEGDYYFHELIGLHVITENAHSLGELIEVLETGANDVYIVRGDEDEELLLPAIEDVILGVDLEKGEMLVHLLPGLL